MTMSYHDESPVEDQYKAIFEMLVEALEHGIDEQVVRRAMRLYREQENPNIEQACKEAVALWV